MPFTGIPMSVYVEPGVQNELTRKARDRGISRSALVRDFLSRGLAEKEPPAKEKPADDGRQASG